jgi:hypothetical protein
LSHFANANRIDKYHKHMGKEIKTGKKWQHTRNEDKKQIKEMEM